MRAVKRPNREVLLATCVPAHSRPADFRARIGCWPIYAAAAGAALASATSAAASIIYDGAAYESLSAAGTQAVHLAGYGTLHLALHLTYNTGHHPVACNTSHHLVNCTATSRIRIGGVARADALFATSGVAVNFSPGAPIAGPSSGSAVIRSHNARGNFASGVPGIAGFRLPGGDLGWIRIEWTGGSFPTSIAALDWAVNNTPGGPINAGQETGGVPEPSTRAMAFLALGAAGVLALRRSRKLAA